MRPREAHGHFPLFVPAALMTILAASCNLAAPPTSAPTTTAPAPASAAPLEDSDASAAVPIFRGDAVAGPREAPVTAVVFVDYECPPCAAMNAEFDARLDASPWLRVAWKTIALQQHPGAHETAEAALGIYALAGASAFRAFSRLALAGRLGNHGAEISRADRLRWAEEAGFADTPALLRGLAARSWANQVDASRELFDRMHLDGVPAIVINGRILDTRHGNLTELLDGALGEARGQAEEKLRAGVPASNLYRVLAAENAPRPTGD